MLHPRPPFLFGKYILTPLHDVNTIHPAPINNGIATDPPGGHSQVSLDLRHVSR
jgi:hypothetical protein